VFCFECLELWKKTSNKRDEFGCFLGDGCCPTCFCFLVSR
jgi:hypothetical protein